jgi:hypothetical protein
VTCFYDQRNMLTPFRRKLRKGPICGADFWRGLRKFY